MRTKRRFQASFHPLLADTFPLLRTLCRTLFLFSGQFAASAGGTTRALPLPPLGGEWKCPGALSACFVSAFLSDATPPGDTLLKVSGPFLARWRDTLAGHFGGHFESVQFESGKVPAPHGDAVGVWARWAA